jgi:hypothetical protein
MGIFVVKSIVLTKIKLLTMKDEQEFKPKSKNYSPASLNFTFGVLPVIPSGKGYQMIADYKKAKQIIEKLLADGREVIAAEMGLDGDWGSNHDVIYVAGEFYPYNAFGSSNWAEPIMIVSFKTGDDETYSVLEKRIKFFLNH